MTYLLSLLGAAGTGLQNYMAVADLLGSITSFSIEAARRLAFVLGGVCSGLVNFCMNIELLESFIQRLNGEKEREKLVGWKKFRYYAGSAVFIVTGILFGLSAFAFGPVGPLAILSVAAGIFVAIIMAIQELETWLQSFDKKPASNNTEEVDSQEEELSMLGKVLGTIISVGNVLALSTFLAIGLSTFLIGLGVAAFPAVIVGLGFAFTFGAATEFYFYNRFLSDFGAHATKNWHDLWSQKLPFIGVFSIVVNASVNAALCYTAVGALNVLLLAAGILVPPLGIAIIATLGSGMNA